jgi:hypothetical protein
MPALPTPTYGERLLQRLLRDLPPKQFFFQYEPQIITPAGYSKPDFVIVSALLGVVVLEVKDWVKLHSGDQRLITTLRPNGETAPYPNPVRTAEGYAYDLNRRFEQRAELWEQYKGRPCLRFPWQVMVALPRISQRIITQFEQRGVWPKGMVIGQEMLASPAHLQRAIHNLPWKYRLEQPLSLDVLDIIREILNPSLVVLNDDQQPVGTLTELQHNLVTEPLRGLLPRQMSLFNVENDLSNEALDIPENAHVRLVRGVAGSGKTLVLVRRVRHMAEIYPEARLLVLTFNVDLAADLRARLGNTPDHAQQAQQAQVEISGFHRLCRVILGDRWRDPLRLADWLRDRERPALESLGLSAPFVAEEFAWRREVGLQDGNAYLEADRSGRGQRLDRAKRAALNALFERIRAAQEQAGTPDWDEIPSLALAALEGTVWQGAYDAIFIDEAQDFAPSWMQMIRALLKPGGSLFICDDPSQSIFRSYTWQQKGLSVVGRSRILRVPFRSTREISQAAHSLIEADDTLRTAEERAEPDFTSYELGSGPLPALIACADAESETRFVTDKVRDLLAAGVPPGQIAILCHAKWHLARWEGLRQQGLYVQFFDRMKGLEFHSVLVPHLHDTFPHATDADEVTTARRKLFTAMTRARWRLFMSYQKTLPKPLEPILSYVWCETQNGR